MQKGIQPTQEEHILTLKDKIQQHQVLIHMLKVQVHWQEELHLMQKDTSQ